MEGQVSDHILIEWLHDHYGIQPRQTIYDEQGFLEELDLSGLKLTAIPGELGQLSNLQKLNLEGNQLTTIPAELGRLNNLQTLYLGENRLTLLFVRLNQRVGFATKPIGPSMLRDTYAVHFLQTGGELFVLQEQFGLADSVSVRRYQRFCGEQRRAEPGIQSTSK